MTRVLLLGHGGMLGTAIRECAPDDMEVVPWGDRFYMNRSHDMNVLPWPDSLDCIINTIGIRPEMGLESPYWMSYLNGVVPHLVALGADVAGVPVIHVSTDCVFGGQHPTLGAENSASPRGRWNAAAPDTLYGRTKLAGESDLAINVRTSFVGPRHGLWKWFVDATERGEREVDGWMQAWWSGSTVNAVASALLELAREPGKPRTVHLATETPICKAEVLAILGDVLRLAVSRVNLVQEPRIDRSLHPDIVLPPFADALREMVP